MMLFITPIFAKFCELFHFLTNMAPGIRTAALILITVCLPIVLFAQSSVTYEFLRNEVSARAAGLGGSFVTGIDDPNVIFYNPAGLATLSGRRISVGYLQHLVDIKSGHFSFGTEIPNLGFIGAGVLYVNYGDFDRTGDEGQNLGTFSAGDLAIAAGYAGNIQPRMTYGVNAKFIYSSIAEARSSAAAVDFGIQYIAVADRMVLGLSVLNLGTQFSPYMTTRENLPLDLNVGMSFYPEHLPAMLVVNFHKLTEARDSFGDRLRVFSVGVEFTPGPNVHLRAGYNNERRQDLKIQNSLGLSGFSVGGGINTEGYTIDYAFTSFGEIGGVHRVTLSF